ncbi:G2/M phase-specific E3 ubiquitin-protein ligase-like isoform X2 [Corythoichthys intestinalis]|uniref:G2/M phase-specific E3 ubiquitin-protein ligase-like isoform X2 n=1 Tax=Corythoichthys intestinalis TaxID=161448 RepID=UPI0025A592E9|nr:G2/M phase-specific E3 ubiquitin-protein ligase-like isoform X2 [Corythoichthys intestinalis]
MFYYLSFQIFGLFQNEFPKMQGLTGGWLLHKATGNKNSNIVTMAQNCHLVCISNKKNLSKTYKYLVSSGGQGKRKLIMIPPDSNGYTGTQIRNVTGSGKMTLYIVPLQHQFDLTPLPPDAIEFEGMPKAQCQTCKVSFPFQILALHVKECMGSQTSEEDTEPGQSESEVLCHGTKKSDEEKLPCPICFLKFTPEFLELHASMCGEREKAELITDDTNGMNQENEEELIKSVDDVLETICGRVDAEKRFTIQITRTNLFERGLLQWQRQKKNSPTSTLEVTFLGEAGVDTGALRKEFLTEMVAGIERRFFEGLQNQKSPRYSLNDFDNGLYRTVGEIFAVSLAQGGPAPTFFSPWTYTYLSGGQTNPTVLNSDAVADVQLRNLIDQVELSTDETLPHLADEILVCGYTGVISIHNKHSIVRAIILSAVLRLHPMLDQIKEGLQLYGLLSLMKQYPDVCQSLFVAAEDVKVTAEFIMASISPVLSDKGTTRRQTELELVNYIQDFLYEGAEDQEEIEPRHGITPSRFLQWITGQGHIPILPSEKKDFAVIVKFNHDCSEEHGLHRICYPVISACAKTITLPVKHMRSYESFKSVLTEAFHLGQEFNIV